MGSPYPRPPGPPQDFVADKVIGIILMVLAGCGVIISFILMAGGGFAGTLMGQAVAEGKATPEEAKAAAGFLGLGLAVAGGIVLAMSVVGIVNGYGIMKSAKWGFILGIALNGLGVVLNLVSINILGILISGALFVYCLLRMTGNVGPKPV